MFNFNADFYAFAIEFVQSCIPSVEENEGKESEDTEEAESERADDLDYEYSEDDSSDNASTISSETRRVIDDSMRPVSGEKAGPEDVINEVEIAVSSMLLCVSYLFVFVLLLTQSGLYEQFEKMEFGGTYGSQIYSDEYSKLLQSNPVWREHPFDADCGDVADRTAPVEEFAEVKKPSANRCVL